MMLSNEDIIEIIEFYRNYNIGEDVYMTPEGVLDIYSLLGIEPETDDFGKRLLTPYELLEIAPVIKNGVEVPIIFSIKHVAKKIHKGNNLKNNSFVYGGAKKKNKDYELLASLKQLYLNALAVGNMSEATSMYDMIDKLTGGNAEEYLGISFNYVKFYKKMRRQLLIDLFANFFIIRMMQSKSKFKKGLFKVDKLYRAFIDEELGMGFLGNEPSVDLPIMSSIMLDVPEVLDLNIVKKPEPKVEDKLVKKPVANETKDDVDEISSTVANLTEKKTSNKKFAKFNIFKSSEEKDKTEGLEEDKEGFKKNKKFKAFAEQKDFCANVLENN